jgi:hypothetical protein
MPLQPAIKSAPDVFCNRFIFDLANRLGQERQNQQ